MRRVAMKNRAMPGDLKLQDTYGSAFFARMYSFPHEEPTLYLGLVHDRHGIAIDQALAKQLKPLIDQIAEAE